MCWAMMVSAFRCAGRMIGLAMLLGTAVVQAQSCKVTFDQGSSFQASDDLVWSAGDMKVRIDSVHYAVDKERGIHQADVLFDVKSPEGSRGLSGRSRLQAATPPSSRPSASPTSLFVPLRFSFCPLLKWCAWVSVRDLSLPNAPSVPVPFFAAKLPTLFASVGLLCGNFPRRSKTRLLKLLGLTSLTATVFRCAPREALEAHSLDLPLLPPRVF